MARCRSGGHAGILPMRIIGKACVDEVRGDGSFGTNEVMFKGAGISAVSQTLIPDPDCSKQAQVNNTSSIRRYNLPFIGQTVVCGHNNIIITSLRQTNPRKRNGPR